MFPNKYYLSLVPVSGNKREVVKKDDLEGKEYTHPLELASNGSKIVVQHRKAN